MKTFYLKLLTIIVVLVGIYLSLTYYLGYTQTKNFKITNEKQSILVEIPNGEYIEIASRNDHITDDIDFNENPFSINTKIQKNSNLENSIAGANSYIEYVENGESSNRLINIKPVDSNEIDIEVISETTYLYKENLKYNIQLDYSNKTEYKEEKGHMYFEDKGCRVEVYEKEADYDISSNKQSLILSKPYDLQIKYLIKMIISCKE